MPDRYEPQTFEQKWRSKWEDADLFRTPELPERPKFYGLDFFPYPSGAGLSVGHCRNYVPTDVLCRMKRMQGYNVLHPMGFDAFGLPAENEAIKQKTHPAPMIDRYAATYKRQMDLIGISYDWSRSFKSSDASYYKWTQWIFLELYKKGLAYRADAPVNWCPKDKTALANEEVVGGLCERCGTPVEKRNIPQWYFRITEYAQRLIDDLDTIDWPEGIKEMQRNWIGRSEGVEFEMRITFSDSAEPVPSRVVDLDQGLDATAAEKPLTFRVFTTRVDTIFGMTFCVLAPEHAAVERILSKVSEEHQQAIREYQAQARSLSDTDRTATNREKTGCFTGAYAINPANGKRVPIFIADYVLATYGTGAIMAVPGHDQRDFDFAVKYGLDVVPVIRPSEAYLREFAAKDAEFDATQALARYLASPKEFNPVFESKESVMINSGEYDGFTYEEGTRSLGEWMEGLGIGERKVTYRLRDWLISRQRYWGCPIPMVMDSEGDPMPVGEDALPVQLPDVERYEPTDDGRSPLALIPEFVNATTPDGRLGQRETDTMGGFACSSWYFLRFCDPHNYGAAWDPEKVKYWMPVDCYVGGAEHAVMHLLYARFWTKVLYDLGHVSITEPFQRLMNQGQVLAMTPYRKPRPDERLAVGEEGILVSFKEAAELKSQIEAGELAEDTLSYRWARMSKSKGNVVTPDEMVEQYGADALRIYELFVAPFDADVQWSNDGVAAAVRYLNRVFRMVDELKGTLRQGETLNGQPQPKEVVPLRRLTHQTIAKCTEDIERFAFNTAIAALMTYLNGIQDSMKATPPGTHAAMDAAYAEAVLTYVKLLAPIAPFSADELWESLGQTGFTLEATWPVSNPELAKDDTITVAVQINGKLRDTLELPAGSTNEELEVAALASPKVQGHIEGKTVRKVIVVPGKLVNVVVA